MGRGPVARNVGGLGVTQQQPSSNPVQLGWRSGCYVRRAWARRGPAVQLAAAGQDRRCLHSVSAKPNRDLDQGTACFPRSKWLVGLPITDCRCGLLQNSAARQLKGAGLSAGPSMVTPLTSPAYPGTAGVADALRHKRYCATLAELSVGIPVESSTLVWMAELVVAGALFTYEQTIACLGFIPKSASADLAAPVETQDAESEQQCVDLSGVLSAGLSRGSKLHHNSAQRREAAPPNLGWRLISLPKISAPAIPAGRLRSPRFTKVWLQGAPGHRRLIKKTSHITRSLEWRRRLHEMATTSRAPCRSRLLSPKKLVAIYPPRERWNGGSTPLRKRNVAPISMRHCDAAR
jgi:hypothetical protein